MGGEPAELAVRDLYDRLLDAWNRRDAAAYAALVESDALVVGFDGSIMTGVEVEEQLGVIFAHHPTARYVAKVRRTRAVGDTAALLHAVVGMVPPDGTDLNPAVNAHQTVLAERRGDDWRIVLFQNTPAQYHGRPELAEQHTAELRLLLAEKSASS